MLVSRTNKKVVRCLFMSHITLVSHRQGRFSLAQKVCENQPHNSSIIDSQHSLDQQVNASQHFLTEKDRILSSEFHLVAQNQSLVGGSQRIKLIKQKSTEEATSYDYESH
jgi:hypothetical protein